MRIIIKDQAELKRIRKLCSTLDNKTVQFPVTVFAVDNEAAAFMDGRPDREFLVTTEEGKPCLQMSARPGARQEWVDRDFADIMKQSSEAVKRLEILKGLEPFEEL